MSKDGIEIAPEEPSKERRIRPAAYAGCRGLDLALPAGETPAASDEDFLQEKRLREIPARLAAGPGAVWRNFQERLEKELREALLPLEKAIENYIMATEALKHAVLDLERREIDRAGKTTPR